MLKYVAIIELSNSSQIGLTVMAENQGEAWKKVVKHQCAGFAKSIMLATILAPEDENK